MSAHILNLSDLVSSGTYAKPDYIPSTATEWYKRMDQLGISGSVTATVTNTNNPAFRKTFTGDLRFVHTELYKLKMKVGASIANEKTRSKKGRVYANKDYIVQIEKVVPTYINDEECMNDDFSQWDLSGATPSPLTFTIDTPSYDAPTFTINIDNGIEYKFNEGALIDEFKNYVDATYSQHYAKDKFQATEFIIDGGHGEGFCLGNVMKYAQRYGKKGSREDARKDLMKVLHYALIGLYVHDQVGEQE